jgi:hypothetical protein
VAFGVDDQEFGMHGDENEEVFNRQSRTMDSVIRSKLNGE